MLYNIARALAPHRDHTGQTPALLHAGRQAFALLLADLEHVSIDQARPWTIRHTFEPRWRDLEITLDLSLEPLQVEAAQLSSLAVSPESAATTSEYPDHLINR